MIDYISHLRHDSARFLELITKTQPDMAVPSCPDWTTADLAWHLAEVQYFWASIVSDLLASPEDVPELARPADAQLPGLFATQSERLVEALQSHDPAAECWSWHDGGHTVGWVLRRQAHEALVHRVDAELAASQASPVADELAEDGIDEILRVMIDASVIPEWSQFVPDRRTAILRTDGGAAWGMELGRFVGTSPNSGTTYDDPALRLLNILPQSPTVTVRSSAANLDLWLWGRTSLDPAWISGDAPAAADIRAAAASGTQ